MNQSLRGSNHGVQPYRLRQTKTTTMTRPRSRRKAKTRSSCECCHAWRGMFNVTAIRSLEMLLLYAPSTCTPGECPEGDWACTSSMEPDKTADGLNKIDWECWACLHWTCSSKSYIRLKSWGGPPKSPWGACYLSLDLHQKMDWLRTVHPEIQMLVGIPQGD